MWIAKRGLFLVRIEKKTRAYCLPRVSTLSLMVHAINGAEWITWMPFHGNERIKIMNNKNSNDILMNMVIYMILECSIESLKNRLSNLLVGQAKTTNSFKIQLY